MRRLLTKKGFWLVPLLAASISCGGSSGASPTPTTPTPTAPTAPAVPTAAPTPAPTEPTPTAPTGPTPPAPTDPTPPVPTQPTPTPPTEPTPSNPPAVTRTHCYGPFRPGDAAPGGCVFEVGFGTAGWSQIRAFADLRAFGGRGDSGLILCPACGGPPWTFDIDLRIPADAAPGPQTIKVWAIDDRGQRVDTTAVVQIVAR